MIIKNLKILFLEIVIQVIADFYLFSTIVLHYETLFFEVPWKAVMVGCCFDHSEPWKSKGMGKISESICWEAPV